MTFTGMSVRGTMTCTSCRQKQNQMKQDLKFMNPVKMVVQLLQMHTGISMLDQIP